MKSVQEKIDGILIKNDLKTQSSFQNLEKQKGVKQMANGIKYIRKLYGDSQEKFKDDVCMEYNEFLEEFILKGGAYYSLCEAILNYVTKKGEKDEYYFRQKIFIFSKFKINQIIELARHGDVAPIVESRYFRDLYREYEASDKSSIVMEQITDKFLSTLDTIVFAIDKTYDEILGNHDLSTNIIKRASDQTEEQFVNIVANEYEYLRYEILSVASIYRPMYDAIIALVKDNNDDFTHFNIYFDVCNIDKELAIEIAKQTGLGICPNLTAFRAIYHKYFKSNKLSKNHEKLIKDFTKMLNRLTCKVDKTYDETFAPDDKLSVMYYKRPIDTSHQDFVYHINVDYNEFWAKFLCEYGPYYDMTKSMRDYMISCGTRQKRDFITRIKAVYALRENKIKRIINKTNQAPRPNIPFYRTLYRRYANSNKSARVKQKITDEFLLAINTLIKKTDRDYDRLFEDEDDYDSPVINIKRSDYESQGAFQFNATTMYNDVTIEFFCNNGAYFDMFKELLKYADIKGEDFKNQLEICVDTCLNEKVTKINTMINQQDTLPCPNPGFFRVLYREFYDEDKSDELFDEIIDNLKNALYQLSYQIDYAYNI